jgi:hypothetical protein
VRLILVAFGRRIVDLELLGPPVPAESGRPESGHPDRLSYDPSSTTACHVEPADDGVSGFGFGLVIRADSNDSGSRPRAKDGP